MPSNGLLSFLRMHDELISGTVNMFQCPQTGFFHFYILRKRINDSENCVSMPSNGLLSFLPEVPETPEVPEMFQCPQTGFFHFYRKEILNVTENDMFQCPQTGFFHFYLPLDEIIKTYN